MAVSDISTITFGSNTYNLKDPTKYTKSGGGIPQTDLEQTVQNKLDKSVVVSPTQPTETENKLWVNTDAGSGMSYQIPTVAESLAMGISGAVVGDLARVAAVDANGRPTSWKHVPLCEIKTNPNLLDNWYFIGGGSQLGDGVFPINQRGQTVYSAAGMYTIDRWKNEGPQKSIEVSSDGLSLANAGSTTSFFCQNLTQPLDTNVIKTLSVLDSDGNLYTTSGKNIWVTNAPFGGYRIENSGSRVNILVAGGKSIKIIAIKLELGSEQTLAHNEGTEESPVWVLNEIPDYGEELAKCQRYCIKLNRLNTIWQWVGNAIAWSTTEIDCFIPTPVTMIRNPSALDISEWMITDGLSYITPSKLALYASSGGIKAVVTVTGATRGKAYFVGASNSGESLLVSADL